MDINIIKKTIRDIPDFPQKGILFKDITPVLQDKNVFSYCIDLLAEKVKSVEAEYICGMESRGFIFGAALAYKTGHGFVPIRKPGKLPADVFRKEYSLEYGSNILEIHKDAFPAGARVLIIDDLLATGGTAKASAELVEMCHAKVASFLFLVELTFLNGRGALKNYPVESIISF
jgi:adenine phosphoribosyltransferase